MVVQISEKPDVCFLNASRKLTFEMEPVSLQRIVFDILSFGILSAGCLTHRSL